MLKPFLLGFALAVSLQPPSRGCVLKQEFLKDELVKRSQPPSRGCVLKRSHYGLTQQQVAQPPSRGCVLKHYLGTGKTLYIGSATFAWLCVETKSGKHQDTARRSATFAWLCVETTSHISTYQPLPSATFAWLCVETEREKLTKAEREVSHLRVAVC